jgi:hypothetical protein
LNISRYYVQNDHEFFLKIFFGSSDCLSLNSAVFDFSVSSLFAVPADFDLVLRRYTEKGFRVIGLAWKPLAHHVNEADVHKILSRVQDVSMYAVLHVCVCVCACVCLCVLFGSASERR